VDLIEPKCQPFYDPNLISSFTTDPEYWQVLLLLREDICCKRHNIKTYNFVCMDDVNYEVTLMQYINKYPLQLNAQIHSACMASNTQAHDPEQRKN